MKINLNQSMYVLCALFTCLASGSIFAKDKTVGEKVDQGVNKVEKTAKAAKDKTKKAAKNTKDKTKEIAKEAEGKAKKAKDKAKEKAHEAID